jgi:alpha-tubulin suppressor-like RCC1 family protein
MVHKSNGAPTLTAFTDSLGSQHLVLAFAGTDNQVNIASTTNANGDFSQATIFQLGQQTNHAPSITSFAGKLYIGWTDTNGSHLNWAEVANLGLGVPAPSLQNQVTLNMEASDDGVFLLGFGDKFIVSWVGSGNTGINYAALTPQQVATFRGNTSLPSSGPGAKETTIVNGGSGASLQTKFTPTFANFGPMPLVPQPGGPPNEAALIYVNQPDGKIWVQENVFFQEPGCTVLGGSTDQGDDDHDGILNCWELSGIDANGDGIADLDLVSRGANPQKADIFVEIDYFDCRMPGGDCATAPDGGLTDTHSHKPQGQSLQAVIAAFANSPLISDPDAGTLPDGGANSGINMHIAGFADPTLDGGPQPGLMEALPHQQFCDMHAKQGGANLPECYFNFKAPLTASGFGTSFGDPSDRSSSNGTNILTAKKLIYHYSLWAHSMTVGGPDNPAGNTGVSGICSPDTLIALGQSFGKVPQEAATLMHELGHDLNLGHGGDEDTNNKPNYLSIMNYNFSGFGMPVFSGSPAGKVILPNGALLDYSRNALASIDELALNEATGVNGNLAGGVVTTQFSCPNPIFLNGTFTQVPANSSPIDWDCDDAGVKPPFEDINGDRYCVAAGTSIPDGGDAAVSNLQTLKTQCDDRFMGGKIVPPDGSALSTTATVVLFGPDGALVPGDQYLCPTPGSLINCTINPDPTGVLNSVANLQPGSPDIVTGTQIENGPDRVCQTTATPGDQQLRTPSDAGCVNVPLPDSGEAGVQETPLHGWNDWALLALGGPGRMQLNFRVCPNPNTSATASSEPVADLVKQSIRQQQAALGVADLGIQGSATFTSPTVTLTYTVTNVGPNDGIMPSINLTLPSGATAISCNGGPCAQLGGVVVVPVPGLTAGSTQTATVVLSTGCGVTAGTATAQIADRPADPNLANNTVSTSFGGAVAVAAGDLQTCTLTASGGVQCWGDNSLGELGIGTIGTQYSTTTPVTVSLPSGVTVTAISGSWRHECALLSDGTVWCWGYDPYGTNNLAASPVKISGLSGIVSISASGYAWAHTCAVQGSDGSVWCWGNNSWGQLGTGDTQDQANPMKVPGLTGAISVAAHGVGTCALMSDRTVQCWGDNSNGELGIGNTSPDTCSNSENPYNVPCSKHPIPVTGLSGPVAAITGGDALHVCALLSNKTVQCWGYNANGQLGDGTTTGRSTPVAVSGLGGVTAIAAGEFHSCATLSGGGVQCWGSNASGQLGNGTTSNSSTPTPVTVLGVAGATTVSGGSNHSCALLSGGAVECWGDNSHGQIGNGTTTSSRVGAVALYGINPVAVTAGRWQTCSLMPSGGVQCWGDNTEGELGIGTIGAQYSTTTPATVSGLSGVATAISGAWTHECALLSDGTVWCWGYDPYGANNLSGSPVQISNLSGIVSISASGGSWAHTCAVKGSVGSVWCWGNNGWGQLGNGNTQDQPNPVQVSGLTGAISVAAHGYGTCALLSNNTVKCWGSNSRGELGIGNTPSPNTCSNAEQTSNVPCSTTPVAVTGLSGPVAAITTGGSNSLHVCALLSNATVQCWGYNAYGQLGDTTTTDKSAPVAVSGLSGVTAITTGTYHSCAALSSGAVQCWGYNASGQLGNGTTTNSPTPTPVLLSGANSALSLGGGPNYSCAVLASGGISCWGDNTYGQLGNGTKINSSIPVCW